MQFENYVPVGNRAIFIAVASLVLLQTMQRYVEYA